MGEEDGRNARQRNWAPPLAPRGPQAPSPMGTASSSVHSPRGIRAPSPCAPSPRGPRAPSPGMGNARGQPTLSSVCFPPQLDEAKTIVDDTASRSAEDSTVEVSALRRWRDELLQLLAAVSRATSSSSEAPVEEVWHWLAANERLTRSVAFVDNAAVVAVAERVAASGGQESEEVLNRWRDATKQLRHLQKESAWNSQYLRVVEEPLKQLGTDDVIWKGSLPSLLKRLLRSLHRVFHSSDYFKEHRMAPLLHRILRELVKQAGRHVPSPYEVTKPRVGYGAAIRAAGQMEESFKAFAEGFFISHSGSSSGTDRRPATAHGTAADRSSSNSRRKDLSSDLGWWRATARTSLEQAEHCRITSDRVLGLLETTKKLVGYLPSLRSCDPELVQQVESFLELYGGVKGGSDLEHLLDLKRRLEADDQIREVQERLQSLISRAEAAGAEYQDVPEHSVFSTEAGGTADVLTLSSTEDISREAVTCESIQDDISSLREDLRQFGSQLENLSDIVQQRSSRTPLAFSPLPRPTGMGVECKSFGKDETHLEDASDAADKKAALEVAKRSTWYKAPSECVPAGTEFISVRQTIEVTSTSVLSDRPRSAHPCLSVRPATAPALSGRRPPSRQAVVAQRLGYNVLDEQGIPTDILPTRFPASTASSSCNFPSFPEEKEEEEEERCEEELVHAEGSNVEELRLSEQEYRGTETQEAPESHARPLTDTESHPEDDALDVLDSEVNPFCNAAVSWSIK